MGGIDGDQNCVVLCAFVCGVVQFDGMWRAKEGGGLEARGGFVPSLSLPSVLLFYEIRPLAPLRAINVLYKQRSSS